MLVRSDNKSLRTSRLRFGLVLPCECSQEWAEPTAFREGLNQGTGNGRPPWRSLGRSANRQPVGFV